MARARRSGVWDHVRCALGRAWLALGGWCIEGEVPDERKFVAIAAPHTSYWDFPHMMAFGFATGQHISFLMKASLFRGPAGALFRALGGIPVDRSTSRGLVEAVTRSLDKADELILVIAPEGTRRRGEYWKSGFYHAARGAGVPIAMGFLDYGRRAVGYGPLLWPSGDIESDVLALQAFYADKRGRHPEQQTPPSLRDAGE
jgi:1-acyl-sn-glycerol-3-phosphate acyltransferase